MFRDFVLFAAVAGAAAATVLAQTTAPTTVRTIWDTPPASTAPAPDAVLRVNARAPTSSLESARVQLKSTDEEWKVIGPKLRKVMNSRREAETALVTSEDAFGFWGRGRPPVFRGPTGDTFAGPGGAGARPRPMMPDNPPRVDPPASQPATTTSAPAPTPATATVPATDAAPKPPTTEAIQPPALPPGPPPDAALMGGGGIVSLALADLRTTLADPKSTPEVIAEKVASLRAARKKAREELVAARDELLLLLTPEQEVTLISLGYLE